jgi:hypothetical protein
MDDALGWALLLGPPIVAGAIAMVLAVRCAKPRGALNRAVYVTWGIGILLGLVTGAVAEMYQPGSIPGMEFFFGGLVQIPVSFLGGLVVGLLSGLFVHLFGPVQKGS